MDTTWPQAAADIRWNRITSSLTKFLQFLSMGQIVMNMTVLKPYNCVQINYYYLSPYEFFLSILTSVILLEPQWLQFSWALLIIPSDLNNALYSLNSSSNFQFPIFSPSLWGPFQSNQLITGITDMFMFQVHQIKLVSPSTFCSTAFSALQQNPSVCLSFCCFFFFFNFRFHSVVRWNRKIL